MFYEYFDPTQDWFDLAICISITVYLLLVIGSVYQRILFKRTKRRERLDHYQEIMWLSKMKALVIQVVVLAFVIKLFLVWVGH